jgi:hypothetical protein
MSRLYRLHFMCADIKTLQHEFTECLGSEKTSAVRPGNTQDKGVGEVAETIVERRLELKIV